MATCAWPPRTTWTRPARSSSRARLCHRLACACPSRSTCTASIPGRASVPTLRWSPSKATGWCRCPTCGRAGRRAGHAERPPARAALAVRPRRLPQGNRPHRRAAGRRTAARARPSHPHCPRRQRSDWSIRMSQAPTAIDARRATRAVRAGIDRDAAYGAVVPPLVLSSNFSFAGFARSASTTTPAAAIRPATCWRRTGRTRGRRRRRDHRDRHGRDHAGAEPLLQPGDRLVVPHDATAAAGACSTRWRRRAVRTDHRDLTDPRALAEALALESPALVWIETPSNPLLRITDLRFVIDAAHKAGALRGGRQHLPVAGAAAPIEDFGADLVLHSTTKYINGHSDVGRRRGGRPKDRALHEQLSWWANCAGPDRLAVRQLPHPARPAHAGCAAARAPGKRRTLAGLAGCAAGGATLYYPGLASHPGACARARQQHGLRRDAERRTGRAAKPRCAPSSMACSTSPWPNRWAASKAWSRIRRR
jgi:cystathionine gamma-synthase